MEEKQNRKKLALISGNKMKSKLMQSNEIWEIQIQSGKNSLVCKYESLNTMGKKCLSSYLSMIF